MTAAEHLEEVVRLMGWDVGEWLVDVYATDGVVRRAVAHEHVAKRALGRPELHEARRREPNACSRRAGRT